MQCYHRHTSYSNLFTPFKDSAMQFDDYAKRDIELGNNVFCVTEHGWQSNFIRAWQAAKKYNLKYVYGVEAYYVQDRKEQDASNGHIVLLAQNMQGIYQINEVLSEANETGYYKVPRVDIELLRKLNPNDVMATTACVAFWGKPDKEAGHVKYYAWNESEEMFETLYDHFGKSLFLEVQAHNTIWQKEVNKRVLELHYKYGCYLIAGTDSHYVYQEQNQERKWLREESGVHFNDEDHEFDENVFEDYPDENTFIERFRKQGVLTEDEITEAIDSTDVLLYFDDIEFDCSRKLPTIYPNLTQEERNQLYLDKVWGAWNERKENILDNAKYLYDEYINVCGMNPDELNYPTAKLYEDAIRYETDIVTSTNMSDYFLLDSEIIRLGTEKGGIITPTARGSASSFFTNTLLGLSTIDRLSLPVKLYPERFVTAERLKTSVADIDLNMNNQKPFADAQEELLGKGHAYPMISFGTLKYKSAFKLFARAQGIPASEANDVSVQIDAYERALKEAEDEEEKESILISDYVDSKYMKYIDGSEPYRGIVVSKSQAPCAFMIYNGDIRKEVGIMRINADGGKKIVYCTVLDGYTAEEAGYIKNDLLVVNVVDINFETMRRAHTPMYSSQDIIRMTMTDKKTWDIFQNGWTQGINQCQSAGTTEKLMLYKPKQLRDLSSFVAAIRPGFKSMLSKFLHRESFSYGVESFDAILQNDSTRSSWLLYQENIMAVLGLAGFTMVESYPVIKAISKKKLKVIAAAKERFLVGFKQYIVDNENMNEEEADAAAEDVWKVIIDSASYSFNACVSGDTVILRHTKNGYHPSIAEMYRIKHDAEYAKKTGHRSLHDKYKHIGYGNALSMFDDGRCYPNEIVDIREAGFRPTYKITTAEGNSIVCTDNHKFPTPKGKKRCDQLSIGDNLYVMGDYEKCTKNYNFTNGNFKPNTPVKGQFGFQKNPDGASVKFSAFRQSCVDLKKPCCECGKPYSDDVRFEVHHRNLDRCNNDPDNLMWLCVSCHKKVHYKNGRRKHGEKGCPTHTTKIISIEYAGEQMTYDVEMKAPAHNFVINNKLITSNSHSVCVSLDALYGAYLKAHYPMEYYSTLLDHYSNKGNKDKVTLIKQEMRKAYGIEIVPCKFRQDNRSFYMDKEKMQMANALHSVKYISKSIANELYRMKDMQFEHFIDLICVLDDNRAFNSRSINILIMMGYFEEFGSKGKLLALYDEFCNGKNRITKTLKDASRNKRIQALYELESSIEEKDIPADEQIYFEAQHYGTPISVFKNEKAKYIVIEIETKYSPKAKLYSLSTGNVGTVKILKKDFAVSPFSAGDIITVKHFTKKPAYSYSNGKRIPKKGVHECWVDTYLVKQMNKEDIA